MNNSVVFSEYQKSVFNSIKNEDCNLIISAVAGSGKTFTIVEACKQLGANENDVLFLAFNKSIQNELAIKMNGYANVSTLHAFGLSVLRKVYRTFRVNDWKYRNYLKENVYTLSNMVTVDTPNNKLYAFICNTIKLFNLCRVNLIQSDEKDKIEAVVEEHNIPLLFDEINVVSLLLDDCYKFDKHNKEIDFVDMIVLPLAEKRYIPTYKYVFIDECQDLNNAQRELMLLAARNGRFIAVGDRKQAINGFCGADCNSFDKIAAIPNTKELPLSVNYRCGVNMINLAKEIVPQIEAHDNAIEGEINHIDTLSVSTFKPNDMILCRSSAPLVGLCFKMLEKGITAIIKGKDIADMLISTIENSGAKTIDELLVYLQEYRNKTIKAICTNCKCEENDAKEKPKYIKVDDNCKCIENLCTSAKSVKELVLTLKAMFSEERKKGAIMLSTIHKSKGLEADRVLILTPNKLPLKWKDQRDWQLEQELNLKYVALTRAKKELIFVDLDDKTLLETEITND